MFANEKYFNSDGIIGIIQRTLNCVDPRLLNHGSRVSYLVYLLMNKIGTFREEEKRSHCMLAFLHDIGAYKSEDIDKIVVFELNEVWRHSIYGYLFLKNVSFLEDQAKGILYHHSPWEEMEEMTDVPPNVKMLAQLIHLADRVDIFYEANINATPQQLEEELLRTRGSVFMPELVDAFLSLGLERDFGAHAEEDMDLRALFISKDFTAEEVSGALQLLVFSIDFRSRHTVTHTITTACVSRELAIGCGLDEETIREVTCAALLHDLGKIGIPVEILEKPGKLTKEETDIMRTHVKITEEILGNDLPTVICENAIRHHEKLDGSGYPKGILGRELTLSQRIVAVGDMVSALMGTRSYKHSFSKEKTLAILRAGAEQGQLDADVVRLAEAEYDSILEKVKETANPVLETYFHMETEYVTLLEKLSTVH